MTFDRFDVCEAWYLYLSTHHTGQGSREYARLSKLLKRFKPRPSLRDANDLSANALGIYLHLVGIDTPLVCDSCDAGGTLFEMWAGAYGTTKALVRADSFESAFEVFVEWLDDNAPGCLIVVDYDEAARALDYADFAAAQEAGYYAVAEVMKQAEIDMTVIGHTTLKHGNAIPSWEWGGQEASV